MHQMGPLPVGDGGPLPKLSSHASLLRFVCFYHCRVYGGRNERLPIQNARVTKNSVPMVFKGYRGHVTLF